MFSEVEILTEDKEFTDLCRAYAKARREGSLRGAALAESYEKCLEKGKSLGLTRYATEEAIEKCLEESLM